MVREQLIPLLVAALVGPLGAYLVAARRFSGKIESSDAKELWAESRSIRDSLTAQTRFLNDELDKVRKRADLCEERERDLHARIDALEAQVAAR